MEAELLRTKHDMMCLNNQLLEAIQRKLELSQELEAWQVGYSTCPLITRLFRLFHYGAFSCYLSGDFWQLFCVNSFCVSFHLGFYESLFLQLCSVSEFTWQV